MALGGAVTDIWKRTDPRAPVWMTLISLIGPIPALVVMPLTTPSIKVQAVIDHGEPLGDPNLGSRKTDTMCNIHGLEHIVDQPA